MTRVFKCFARTGKWTLSYLALMFRSPALIGAFAGGRKNHKNPELWKHGYYPAVINNDTWFKLQSALKTNAKNKGTRVNSKDGTGAVAGYDNLLTGLGFCSCGYAMHHSKTTNKTQSGSNTHYYLRCSSASKEGSCNAGVFHREHTERALFKVLAMRMLHTGYEDSELSELTTKQDNIQHE